DVVSEAVSIVRRSFGPWMTITTHISPEAVVYGSREELHQVLHNLLVNARDAMPTGGELRVSASIVQLDRASSLALHLPTCGTYVELKVADPGRGMDKATLARIFEPFFTTKPPGKGSGLGLAVIHAIVKRHGGTVIADSELGRGTTFKVYIPRVD
nr:hypothetical protein [Deltaproteobacteria bacterium]